MNHKEEAALKQCSGQIKKDLDPTYAFLHSLVVEGGITHDEMEVIMGLPTRETKATKLLTILPRRGPTAFLTFRNLLKNDYHWLADALGEAFKKQNKKSTDEEIHQKLTAVVNKKFVPLVFSGNFNYADHRDHISQTIVKVGYLATMLEQKVHKALELPERSSKNVSIEKLIEQKLKDERSGDDLAVENQELKKKLKQEEKLRKENTSLKLAVEGHKIKLKEQQRSMKEYRNENIKLKRINEKMLKEIEILERENQSMKKELASARSGCDIQEMF